MRLESRVGLRADPNEVPNYFDLCDPIDCHDKKRALYDRSSSLELESGSYLPIGMC